MSAAVDFVASAIGSVAVVFFEHPFDTIKVLLQSGRYERYRHCIDDLLHADGVRGFYRGVSMRVLIAGFGRSIVLVSYKASLRLCGCDEDRPTTAQVIAAGCMSGVATTAVLTPVETVKCRVQAGCSVRGHTGGVACSKRPLLRAAGGLPTTWRAARAGACATRVASSPCASPWDCAKQLYRRHGVRGFYKGASAVLCREVPGNIVWCGTYDFLKMRMTKDGESPKDLPLWKMVLAGGCSGVAFWTAIFPADVVKTRMQVDPSFAGYSFSRALARQYREVGVRGLYRGWALTAARSFPSNAMIFMCYDVCSRFMHRPCLTPLTLQACGE